MDGLNTMTLESLACLLMLQQQELLANRYGSHWILLSMAVRLAYALNLHKEPASDLPWAEQEYRRRLMWAAYMSDGYAADGNPMFRLCPPNTIHIQLPCTDRNYILQRAVITQHLDSDHMTTLPMLKRDGVPSDDGGLYNRTVRLASARFKVIQYIKHLESMPPAPWERTSTAEAIQTALQTWLAELPPELCWNVDNLYARQQSDQITPFLMLHITYHNCHLMLYRIALPGSKYSASKAFLQQAPAGWVQWAQQTCFHSSQSIHALVLEAVDTFPDVLLTDPAISITIREATRVQLAYLGVLEQSGARDPALISRLESTYQRLMRVLTKLWAVFPLVRPLTQSMQQLLESSGFKAGIDTRLLPYA